MGTWGPGISSNDVYADAYGDFMRLYDRGSTPEETIVAIKADYQSDIENPENANDFWFALAKAQWELCVLDPQLLTYVADQINSGKDIERWRQLGASTGDIRKRKAALNKFLVRISQPKAKPRKRKKPVFIDSIFETGDCLAIKLPNGRYGGCIVLSGEQQTEYGINWLVLLDYCADQPPIMADFQYGQAMPTHMQMQPSAEPLIACCFAQQYKKAVSEFDKIGSFPIKKGDPDANWRTRYMSWDLFAMYCDLSTYKSAEYAKRIEKANRTSIKAVIGDGWMATLRRIWEM